MTADAACVQPRKDGDQAALRQALADWRALQDYRAQYGLKRQSVSVLARAAAQKQAREEATTEAGVQYRSANREYVMGLR